MACRHTEPPTLHAGPPSFPVRTPAEFEPVERVVLQWDPGEVDAFHTDLIAGILRAGAEPVVLVDSADAQQFITRMLKARALPIAQLRFLVVNTDSIWTRDYAGRSVFAGARPRRILVDWNYDYPGALYDDFAPQFFGPALDTPVHTDTTAAPVFFSWGDLLVDGFGNGFSSKKVLEHNPGDGARLRAALSEYLGLARHTLLERLEFGPNNHIDMYMKLLDEETILIAQYNDTGNGTHVLDANAAYLATLPSCYDRPYRVVRVPMPGDSSADDFRTYTNSLIVNNLVLLPVYQVARDKDAIEIYREHMPGYEILPIDARGLTQQRGAIRCVTSEMAAENRIRIGHPRFLDPVTAGAPVRFTATAWPPSQDYKVDLYLRHSPWSEFFRIPMTQDAGVYNAVHHFTEAGHVEYYIQASDGVRVGFKPQNASYGGYLRLEVGSAGPA